MGLNSPLALLIFVYSTFSMAADVFEKPAVNDLYWKYSSKLSCLSKIEKSVPKKEQKKRWYPLTVNEPNKRSTNGIVFRNYKTGVNYKIYTYPKAEILEVENSIDSKVEKYEFEKGMCNLKQSTQALTQVDKTTSNEKVFSEKELKSLVNENKLGIIYIWSPYMPLSVEGIAEIKKAAKNLNAKLVILMDAKAKISEANKWVEKSLVSEGEKIKIDAQPLFDRGLGTHYPSVFITYNGFLSNADYVGFKKNDMYEKWINIETKLIEQDMK